MQLIDPTGFPAVRSVTFAALMNPIVEINHQALDRALVFLKANCRAPVRDVLLLSPYLTDFVVVRKHWPDARFFIATQRTWNLNSQFPGTGTVDLVVASNVFHYSPDPALWFGNVANMTRFFLVQDLISRRRSTTDSGLCDDGDRVRYRFSGRGVESDFVGAYDLASLGRKITYFEAFDGGRNEHHSLPAAAPMHFCAIIESPQEATSPRLGWGDFLRFGAPALSFKARSFFGGR